MPYAPQKTTEAFAGLVQRQGGALMFHSRRGFYAPTSLRYVTPVSPPSGYKPFDISIYNYQKDQTELTMRMIVNPTNIQVGQVFLASNTYTRNGWVSTLWGRQQSTISANGTSAAFYLASDGFRRAVAASGQPTVSLQNQVVNEGLVNYNRKDSIGFINLLTLASIFRNNGAYFLKDPKEQTIFKDGTNRVINVLDSILISYDGSEYVGSFNAFTLDEAGDRPYQVNYNFEYVISGIRGSEIEGHLHRDDNNKDSRVEISVQGSDSFLAETVFLNAAELDADHRVSEEQLNRMALMAKDFRMDRIEKEEERSYYSTRNGIVDENWDNVQQHEVPNDQIDITSTSHGRSEHAGKADVKYPENAKVRAFSEGKIVRVQYDGLNKRGGDNYIVIETTMEINGKEEKVWIRSFHMDNATIKEMLESGEIAEGKKIFPGDPIGKQGSDGGAYPRHVDYEIKIISTGREYSKSNYKSAQRGREPIMTDYLFSGMARLYQKNESWSSDYSKLVYKESKEYPSNKVEQKGGKNVIPGSGISGSLPPIEVTTRADLHQ